MYIYISKEKKENIRNHIKTYRSNIKYKRHSKNNIKQKQQLRTAYKNIEKQTKR